MLLSPQKTKIAGSFMSCQTPVIPFSLKNIYFEAHHFLTSSSEKSGNAEF